MKRTICVLAVWLLVFGRLEPLDAQENTGEQQRRQVAFNVYLGLAPAAKAEMDGKINSLIEVGEKRNKRALTPHELTALRGLIASAQYQMLIDQMACVERHGDQVNMSKVDGCVEERRSAAEEMFRFMSDYSSLDAQNRSLTLCLAKTRLFQLEMRYPPYEFMRGEGPQTHDARLFLECVRARM